MQFLVKITEDAPVFVDKKHILFDERPTSFLMDFKGKNLT